MSVNAVRSLRASEASAAHLAGCFAELYESLGQVSTSLEDDAFVVAVFEFARRCGDLRQEFLALRAHRAGANASLAQRRLTVIGESVAASVAEDPSGALTLYVVTSVLGPRLLISLRDVAALATGPGEGPLRETCQEAASVLIAHSRYIGEIARVQAPQLAAPWHAAARRLEALVTQAGYGESFGTGESG